MAPRSGCGTRCMADLLAITGLHAGYGATEVLRGIDLAVGANEIVAVLGSNGAGKSTLNRAISGVLRPWSGAIRFEGAAIQRARASAIVSRGLIHVPEGRRIFPNMSVGENLDLGCYRRARARREQNRERVFTIFPRLAERQTQSAGTLSGGEQQMLAIGRGLMAEPKLLILDEPSLGLSPLLVEELFALIRRINADGVALLLVEQNVVQSLDVVRPTKTSVDCLDIAVAHGKIIRLAPDIQADQGKQVFDARNLLAFPGCVDAHMHIGIYAPLAQDAVSESKAAAIGGVTSSLNYMRTGHYYLNRGGPYRDFMPEVLRQSEGRFWVDYG